MTRRRPRRRPADLPLGLLPDSPEAAAHLLRLPAVRLVVDGYNVALSARAMPSGRPPVADLAGLRARLLDALSELVVRIHASVTVVFDGAEEGGRVPAPSVARPWLRIVFSASGVEADEVIRQSVEQMRPGGPVVVASDDRQVQVDAERLGANVISVAQLLAVLNRHTLM